MSTLERSPWMLRKFAFGHPEWMLADLVERLRGLVPRVKLLTANLADGVAYQQHEGKWSIAQNIGHLSDVETLWQERLEDLRRGRPVYTPADSARFQAAALQHQERSLAAIVAELDERRGRLCDALLSAPPALMSASALHERLKIPMRLVDCAQFYAEHDDHHLLRVRTLRLLLGH
jgi:uncharacterized damage-inducible protein DinB